jgi:hypothetical protein
VWGVCQKDPGVRPEGLREARTRHVEGAKVPQNFAVTGSDSAGLQRSLKPNPSERQRGYPEWTLPGF